MATSIYQCSPALDVCLRQGEILSGLIRFTLDPTKIGESEPSVVRVEYPYAVVLSQACDLEQDFRGRQEGKPPQLPDVLFCQLPTAQDLKASCPSPDIWKRVKQNKDERYHFLENIPLDCDRAGAGIPELGIDFKRYFTLPTTEVYQWLKRGDTQRRSVICSPYLEHLSSRFAYFLSRVGLPHDHVSE